MKKLILKKLKLGNIPKQSSKKESRWLKITINPGDKNKKIKIEIFNIKTQKTDEIFLKSINSSNDLFDLIKDNLEITQCY